jgi:ATP phosphoribosyltransferase regulatory subunit
MNEKNAPNLHRFHSRFSTAEDPVGGPLIVNENNTDRWQLPDGVNELLPADAWWVEKLRRQIIDNSFLWGYELVMPPLIEYLDSLLTGTGETLDLQTFKIIDQHNGRTLGIRADMTPQVARMDAHALRSEYPNRFVYTGTVLRTRTDGAGSSRTPLQFGAELFGHPGPESDAEIIQLMLDNIVKAGVVDSDLLLDMGHVGVYRAMVNSAALDAESESHLFDAIVRGSQPDVKQILDDRQCEELFKAQIYALMELAGDYQDVLHRARQQLCESATQVHEALDNLQLIIEAVLSVFPKVSVHVDLAELRGYRYHTGTIFTLYDSEGCALARGGRYDAIGEEFGHARSATGFSGDLINLAHVCRWGSTTGPTASTKGIWVQTCDDAGLWRKIQALRSNGERVLKALPGSNMRAQDSNCDRRLVKVDDQWIVESID